MDSHGNWNYPLTCIRIRLPQRQPLQSVDRLFWVYECRLHADPLPTPPYVIALGKVFHPGIVALAGAIGNVIAAFVEYHLLLWFFSKTALQQRVETNRIFQRFSYYFRRMAFVCLVFTGFTPIPFEPFRFAAILTRYNLFLYLLAVLLGRFPRYYLIALIGDQFQIPTRYLIVLLIVSLVIPIIGMLIKRNTSGDNEKLTTDN